MKLESLPEAFDLLGSGDVTGKIVIDPSIE